jgi:hypothetical protein
MVGQPPRQRAAPDDDVDLDRDEDPKRRPFVAADWQLFEYVESGQISPTAAFLYMVLLKRWPAERADKRVWPSRESLAVALNLSRPESVDPYLRQLRDVGLISWEPWRIGGMRARNRYTLHLIADLKSKSDSSVSSVPLKTAQRSSVFGGPDTPKTEGELEQGELPQDELDPTKNSSRTASPPLASLTSVPTQEESTDNFDGNWAGRDTKGRADDGKIQDWRPADLDLFRSYVGDNLRTNGEHWGRDGEIFSANAFYRAFRLKGTPRIRWPGRFLAKLETDGMDVEDWLINQGLEKV